MDTDFTNFRGFKSVLKDLMAVVSPIACVFLLAIKFQYFACQPLTYAFFLLMFNLFFLSFYDL